MIDRRIRLIPNRSTNQLAELDAESGGPLLACDFYVDGVEQGREVPGGYEVGRLVNVDHHAPTRRMERMISSANLAIERIVACGPAPSDACVLVNHTDCDTVLSCGIITGMFAPLPALGAAAIAADHTGAPDPLADLLQGIDHLARGRDDAGRREVLALAFRSVPRVLDGGPLERAAVEALDGRLRRREAAAAAVARGEVRYLDATRRVAVGVLERALDGEFFPALLPDAVVIMLAARRADERQRWDVKLRLGAGAPAGFSLHRLALRELDPGYGGRWNAGSNRRGGGTALPPERWAAELAQRVERSRGA